MAALLPLGTSRDDIPARLQLYMRCRYERATMVQVIGRQIADDDGTTKDGEEVVDRLAFTGKLFSYDAFEAAREVLREVLGGEGGAGKVLAKEVGVRGEDGI